MQRRDPLRKACWVNRAVPTAEFDAFVDSVTRRIASLLPVETVGGIRLRTVSSLANARCKGDPGRFSAASSTEAYSVEVTAANPYGTSEPSRSRVYACSRVA